MNNCPYTGKPTSPKTIKTNKPLKIGWIVDAPKAGFIYFEPERVKTDIAPQQHAKSAARCPAVLDMESRHFLIRCPFDLHIALIKDDKGRTQIRNLAGDDSAIRQNYLAKEIHLVSEKEWRHPSRPMIQINAPYLFVADEPVYLTQAEPFMHFNAKSWPGLVFGGRLPTHIWPRTLMWAFEWFDISKPLKIKRGDPWFYAYFETDDLNRRVKLVEATMTSELCQHTQKMASVTNYVNQTFSLFKEAEKQKNGNFLVEK